MAFRLRQRGLSMISFLFTAAVLVTIALVGFRILPAYIEYYSVKKALELTLADDSVQNVTQLRNAMGRRIDAQYIESVSAGDVRLDKVGNGLLASVTWQRILPMVANASILLDFTAEAAR
jgi:hypothetical protein